MKKLNEMTLEELWQLFPIILKEHNSCWKEWYNEEVAQLKNLLSSDVKYHHIGSTAINEIMAKPIIDILVVVNSKNKLKQTASILEKNGYIIMSTAETRISLNKGYTENGYAERVFHIHIRLNGDADEIFFRDYLNAHCDVASEYENLKLKLAEKYRYNRDAYTDAKSEFVNKYTLLAKGEIQ